MVKGISKQAVVVRPAENGVFEQAIFVLSDDAAQSALRAPEDMLSLAQELASGYALPAPGSGSRARRRSLALYLAGMLTGGLVTGLFWLATLLGVS